MLISYMIQNYFGIPFQMFTEKAIAAYALLTVVEGVPEADVARIKWIQENTDSKVMVSLFKLDRSINPGKGTFDINRFKKRFIRNDASQEEVSDGNATIELDEDSMQHILCSAINEVHQIVARNIKGYKEEIKFDGFMMDAGTDASKRFGF